MGFDINPAFAQKLRVELHLPVAYRFEISDFGNMHMTNKELKKQEIIRQIKALASANDGLAPGRDKFQVETGISKHEWMYKIWRSWGDALTEAGFAPNALNTKLDDASILAGILKLADKIQKFPNTGDLAFEGSKNPEFPNLKTISKRWSMKNLAEELRFHAEAAGNLHVADMCNSYLSGLTAKPNSVSDKINELNVSGAGYVYLISYEKHFKIGRTKSITKRSRQVQIELPNETILIHAILTDDPVGVEAYWHKRFSDKRGNGEWFALGKSDINSFKKWKKIA